MKIIHSNIQVEFSGDEFTGYCCASNWIYSDHGTKRIREYFIRGAETCWCETWWQTWDHLWELIGFHGQLLLRFEEL